MLSHDKWDHLEDSFPKEGALANDLEEL